MRYILISLALFLSACSIKHYEQTETKIFVIKSPLLRFADLAYIRNSENAVQVELFVAGKSIKKIAINHLVCVDEGCVSKSTFNTKYLNANYPSNILQNILLAKAIYNGKNRVQMQNGFVQKIQTENVNIKYTVTNKVTLFKDRKNKIIIKIKDTSL